MEKDSLDRLLESAYALVEPPAGLDRKVLTAVYQAERARLKKLMILHSMVFAVLSTLAVWCGGGLATQMSHTGFVQIFSMMWTDSSIAISNLGDWGMAMLETLPLAQLVLTALLLYSAGYIGVKLVRESKEKLPLGVA